MVDRSSRQALAAEPGLALARRESGVWKITFMNDPDWQTRLAGLPDELLTGYIRDNFLLPAQSHQPQDAPVGGFYLPWAAGLSKWLTMAANHISCPTNCRYATDWADGTHFPVLAAKSGTVYGFNDTCENDDHSCTNYLVLQDTSTNPYTYQIYFHLEHNSIPGPLKVIDPADPPQVYQGQYIANADNTGNSTGPHLHFMVVTNPFFCIPAWCNGDSYWWGKSIDITFRDVSTNWDVGTQGGRPCTYNDVVLGLCAEWQATYTSGNTGIAPPAGELTQPADHSLVTDPNLTVSGWASSILGITHMQLIANYNGAWHEVGPSLTDNPFTTILDVCAAGIPEGVFDLALRAWDSGGGQSITSLGLHHLAKDTHCTPPPPQPVCVPGANQVSLYSEPNFGGDCALLDPGNYPDFSTLSPLIDNGVVSVRVGANVIAVLYDGTAYTQRQETFISDDHNLADNRVNDQQVSSIKVLARTTIPSNPTFPVVTGPGGNPLTSIDSVVLSWEMGDGAVAFLSRLYQKPINSQDFWDCNAPDLPNPPFMSRQPDDFLPGQSWSVGTLPEGKYTLCLRGRVSGANMTSWVGNTFTVTAQTLPGATPFNLPYSTAMDAPDASWIASGLWHWQVDPRNGNPGNGDWIFNNSASGDYSADSPTFGDFTSPLINVTAPAYLRFDYYYETEAATTHWDQRWVQVSRNGGPFQNLVQLSDEVMNFWLHSPVIDLSAYAGSSIRLRFHFDSIDIYHNAGRSGWAVDNFSVTAAPPPAGCILEPPGGDGSIDKAVLLHYGDTVAADICPGGDLDYYKITAAQGDVIVADINAQTLNPPSTLDSTLTWFLDSDPLSVVAFNDDELPAIQLDSYLVYTAPQDGTYYLRVKAWDYPSAGGPTDNYTLHLSRGPSGGNDTTDPVISLTNPAPGAAWRALSQTVTAQASDNPGGSGVKDVAFFWHAWDWQNTSWQPLWTDWNGTNGWNALLDASQIPEGDTIGIAAVATDWAGNASVAVDYDVIIDNTPPVVNLAALNSPSEDTPVRLQWTASDAASGIAFFDLEVNRDNSGWQAINAHLPGTARQYWYIGEFGHHYDFRIQAVDFANNASDYSSTGTTINACHPDQFEVDNTQAAAVFLPLETMSGLHNLCGVGDQDWMKFTPVAGQAYLLWALPEPGSTANPIFGLYRSGETTAFLSGSAADYGQWVVIKWTAPNNDTYYLNVHSLNPAAAGTLAAYQLWVGPGYNVYIPHIGR